MAQNCDTPMEYKTVVPSESEATPLIPSFDIFKIDSDGRVIWHCATESLVVAKSRIAKLAVSTPGEYLILDQNTGHRLLITLPVVSTQVAAQAA